METVEFVLHIVTTMVLMSNILLIQRKNKQLAQLEKDRDQMNQQLAHQAKALLDKYGPEIEEAMHSTEYKALQQLAEYSETFAPAPQAPQPHWRPYAEAEKRYLMQPKNEDEEKP